MAATITACERQQGQGETATIQASGESETQIYLVTVQENTATPLEVERATHASMPAYNSTHSINTSLKVLRKTAKRAADKARTTWIVEVEYGIPPTTGGTGNTPVTGDTSNSQNIHVRVTGQETAILTQNAKDTGKTPIRNAAGDLYPDPIEVYQYDELIAIDFETSAVSGSLVATSRGKINNSDVTLTIPQGSLTYSRTFASGTLLLKSVDYEAIVSKVDPTQNKWHANVVLLYRPDTWHVKLPEKGYRWITASGITEWKDHAEYLDGNGFKLGGGNPIVETDPIQRYESTNLATLLGGI